MEAATSSDQQAAYAYLLGLYLGDGYLSPAGQLRLTLDAAYPGIAETAALATSLVVPHGRAHVSRHDSTLRVEAGWTGWKELIPQHGRGKKHERRIRLAAWQEGIVGAYPHEFLCGLLDSDGCRCVNRFTTRLPSGRVKEYSYVRYFFSNLSADIRELFCRTCDQLGLRWTKSNPRNISVSHRTSTRRLDDFVGAKH